MNSDFTMYGEIINNPNIIQYNPKKIVEFEKKYKLTSQLYENPLGATKILIGNDFNDTQYAIKEIKKEKLKESFYFELAKNELSIHFSLSRKSNYIVGVPEYYENDSSYFMIMDFCTYPNYFQYRLENVYIIFNREIEAIR